MNGYQMVEDTLKELYHLTRQRAEVRDSNLIRAAYLHPDRLALILSEFKRRGWVNVEQGFLNLMPAGKKRVVQLIRAHRL